MEKRYQREDLEVIWKPELCIHSGVCARGLPKVFDPNRRPWIDLSHAEIEEIKSKIEECPSGALSYVSSSDAEEQNATESVNQVRVLKDGPLAISGPCAITTTEGEVLELQKDAFLCRCGASSKKPFCDGSHKKVDFIG